MAKTLLQLLAVACIILDTTQLLAAQATVPPPTIDPAQTAHPLQAVGPIAPETLKDKPSDTLATISATAGSDPKNANIVSNATSNIAQATVSPQTMDPPPAAATTADPLQAVRAQAAGTLNDKPSDTIASITAAAGSEPKNADIVSNATSNTAQATVPPPTIDPPPSAATTANPNELTQSEGAKAGETLKNNVTDTLATISVAVGSDPKNGDMYAVNASADQTAIQAASSVAVAAIQAALSTALSYFQTAKAVILGNEPTVLVIQEI